MRKVHLGGHSVWCPTTSAFHLQLITQELSKAEVCDFEDARAD